MRKYIILEQKCHIMQDPGSTSHSTKRTKNKIRATRNNLEASQKQPSWYLSFFPDAKCGFSAQVSTKSSPLQHPQSTFKRFPQAKIFTTYTNMFGSQLRKICINFGISFLLPKLSRIICVGPVNMPLSDIIGIGLRITSKAKSEWYNLWTTSRHYQDNIKTTLRKHPD